MRRAKIFFIIIAALGIGLLAVRTYNSYRFHAEKETRFMMDTSVTIYAIGPKEITVKAINSAFNRLKEIDMKFNSLDPQSPVYAFNHGGRPISDPAIVNLIKIASQVSDASEGAFDITISPLLELWKFYDKAYRIPEEEEIKKCLLNVGYRHLLFNNGKLEKDNEEVRIDLGGIAKGYALGEAAKILKAEGVSSALIDAGGDIYALGKKGKRLWKVGIKDPRGKGILGYVEVEDLAVIGSGDYERFFIKDGKRYHHIFSPKTGYPTEGVIGVTLIYSDPIAAQAWAKIPFILGPEKGLAMLEKISGMEVIIITSSGEKLCSSSLKYVIIKREDRDRFTD